MSLKPGRARKTVGRLESSGSSYRQAWLSGSIRHCHSSTVGYPFPGQEGRHEMYELTL